MHACVLVASDDRLLYLSRISQYGSCLFKVLVRSVINILPYIAIVVNTPENLFVQRNKVIAIHVERDAPGMYVCMYVCVHVCTYVCMYVVRMYVRR